MRHGRRLTSFIPRAALLLGCAIFLTAWRFGPPLTFFEDEHGIADAVARISGSAGTLGRVLSIAVTPEEVRVQAQDATDKRHVNEWMLVRSHIRSFNWETLKGPEPVELTLINRDLEANLFDIAEVDLKASGKVAQEALSRAALEDPAAVTSMEIRRQVFILPEPSSGNVSWKVDVGSGRESASVYADAKGNVVRIDLAGTNRARTFDLLKSLALLPEARHAFEEGVGSGQVLTKVTIGSGGVGFGTNLSQTPLIGSIKQTQSFHWSLNGLERGLGGFDLASYFEAPQTFSIKDADWSLVEDIVRRAKSALDMRDGTLAEIELTKPGDGPGAPQLEWTITIRDNTSRERGQAHFDTKGETLRLLLPESRRKPFDGRDPANWPAMLSKIETAFGADGQIAELTIDKDHLRIVAADPQKPSDLAEFLLDDKGFTRFGTPSPFAQQNRRFTFADLRDLTPERLRTLQTSATERLKLPLKTITSITIGRASMDPSPEGRVTVEIRAEEAPFGRGGRVNYEINGREIKAYLP
jgi:hypothetical protein